MVFETFALSILSFAYFLLIVTAGPQRRETNLQDIRFAVRILTPAKKDEAPLHALTVRLEV